MRLRGVRLCHAHGVEDPIDHALLGLACGGVAVDGEELQRVGILGDLLSETGVDHLASIPGQLDLSRYPVHMFETLCARGEGSQRDSDGCSVVASSASASSSADREDQAGGEDPDRREEERATEREAGIGDAVRRVVDLRQGGVSGGRLLPGGGVLPGVGATVGGGVGVGVGSTAGSIWRVMCRVAGSPKPLSACTVNVAWPDVVGVPESAPLVASRRSPSGRPPAAIEKLDGGEPATAKMCEYGVPTVPDSGVPLTNVGASPTVTVWLAPETEAIPVSAVTEKVKAPVAVGVPDSAPKSLKASPSGSVPETVNLGVGDPVAVKA